MTDLQIPDGVFAVNTSQALKILGISRSTLGDFKECLNGQQPEGWDYLPNQRGVTVRQLRILWVLRRLVETLGRPSAEKQINSVVKEYLDNG